ncbi:MAG TPA: D-alanyl-D-alanine carboxypeptidase family protein [Solirubrobacteraceae bacterium]|nr:D-alanyl-D-alanine carboxypeptidase family protein [Solirubrobacteraceae bacterium]
MTQSPFLTPDQSRRRRELAAQRRRTRRTMTSAFSVGVVGAVIVAMALANRSAGHQHHASHASSQRSRATTAKTPTLSPIGLPLAKPALALAGVATPSKDPVHVPFHTPPRAGMLFDLSTGQVLWERNPYLRVPIASLTKMMTALLTVQAAAPNALVLVTPQAIATSGSKVGVLPLGRHVRLESMLYGLLLPSGNDAAEALAQRVAGSAKAFVARMNSEAAQLGMGCTRYSSPSGFYDAGNFSCAADLAVLAHVDIAQPRIARVTHTYAAVLPFPIKGGKLYLYNNNPLLIYKYPGTTGLKTGWTEAAGRCLVATAERGGVRLGVVLLNSDAPATQASKLLNSAFEHVYHLHAVAQPPIPPDA